MRVDRMSSIVYTLKKLSLLTSITILCFSSSDLATCRLFFNLQHSFVVLFSRFLRRIVLIFLEKWLRAVKIFYSTDSITANGNEYNCRQSDDVNCKQLFTRKEKYDWDRTSW